MRLRGELKERSRTLCAAPGSPDTLVRFVSWRGERGQVFAQVLEHDAIFVAREKVDLRDTPPCAARRGGAIVIEQLFVAPGHERRGNGHRLLAYAEGYAIAERARVLQIAVEEGNAQARSFYRRSGFAAVERELFERLLPSATNAVRGGGDMATGTVKWFSNDKRYGFITQDDGGKDVFVHHSAIRGRGHKSLAEGARVEYEVEQEPRGPQARDVHAAGSA